MILIKESRKENKVVEKKVHNITGSVSNATIHTQVIEIKIITHCPFGLVKNDYQIKT